MRVALRLITYEDYNSRDSIRLLTQWRKQNKHAYKGNYKITQKSVKQWLKEYVLDNPDRFLFWVIVNGEKIGHIGVKNIKKDSIELDNVARGVSYHKGAMTKALFMVIAMYEDKRMWLKVLESNKHACFFYLKNGFKIVGSEHEFMILSL